MSGGDGDDMSGEGVMTGIHGKEIRELFAKFNKCRLFIYLLKRQLWYQLFNGDPILAHNIDAWKCQ